MSTCFAKHSKQLWSSRTACREVLYKQAKNYDYVGIFEQSKEWPRSRKTVAGAIAQGMDSNHPHPHSHGHKVNALLITQVADMKTSL